MKFKIFLFTILIFSCHNDKIEIPLPMEVVQLPNVMFEISGIICNTDHTILAHNDSGNPSNIYEVSLMEKNINRTINISNAQNLDWEDMTEDDDHIYLGDFGNNLGGRKNLKIYKVKKNELAIQDSVLADSIDFFYPEQVDFTLRNNHNYDCEAMIVFENELFLFTKNRVDLKTNWYSLPIESGNHSATFNNSFDTEGLISGATINDSKNVIALLGYTDNNSNYTSFIWLFYDFSSDDIFNGKKVKIDLTIPDQFEAIDFQNDHTLIFAGEKENGGEAGIVYRLDIEKYL